MKRLLVIGIVGIGLAGCQNPIPGLDAAFGIATGSVSVNDVYIAANSFDAVQSSAQVYIGLPLCKTGGPAVCRTQAATVAVDKAVRSGRSLRKQLISAAAANPSALVPVSNYTALLAAITTIQTYIGGTK